MVAHFITPPDKYPARKQYCTFFPPVAAAVKVIGVAAARGEAREVVRLTLEIAGTTV
jgi:hypothetical protein